MNEEKVYQNNHTFDVLNHIKGGIFVQTRPGRPLAGCALVDCWAGKLQTGKLQTGPLKTLFPQDSDRDFLKQVLKSVYMLQLIWIIS